MSKTIEIVNHCFSRHCDHYRAFLATQMESLVRHPLPEKHQVLYTVVTHVRDYDVLGTIGLFSEPLLRSGVRLKIIAQETESLLRRAIGRNIASLSTSSDVVWYVDTDYWFGKGCIQSVIDRVPIKSQKLFTPKEYFCHDRHSDGDSMAKQVLAMLENEFKGNTPLDGFSINPKDFYLRSGDRAIGGLQIVSGHVARSMGYLNGTRWVVPKTEAEIKNGWQRTKDDPAYRKLTFKGDSGKKVEIPNLFRFRHSTNGRDINDQVSD